MVRFLVLGPVEAWAGPVRLPPGTAKQRAVLAVLLADAGRVVPMDVLVDRVWGPDLPSEPRRVLQSYLARIRTGLRRVEPAAATVLVRRSGGYLLDVDPDQVDLHRFRRLAGARTGTRRVETLRASLDCWQGTPLTGVTGAWADQVRAELHQQRLDAEITLAELEIGLGHAGDVLGRLRELAAAHPLAEPVAALLITALAALDRSAEALACYATVRGRLRDELGIEPGPRLRALHEATLRELPPAADGAAAPVTGRRTPGEPVPRDGARRPELDPLPRPEAVALLRRILGPRVDAEPAAAADLAERCARLPLALGLAAELARCRPGTALADLAAELAERHAGPDRPASDHGPRAAGPDS